MVRAIVDATVIAIVTDVLHDAVLEKPGQVIQDGGCNNDKDQEANDWGREFGCVPSRCGDTYESMESDE